jgi:plastocyanin
MRRLPALLLVLPVVVVLAACSASAAPGWTYAPAASEAPAASGAASGAPSSSAPSAASVAPSVAASVAPPPSTGQGAGASGGTGTSLTVTAPMNAAASGFNPTTLTATANAAFTLVFDDQDNTVPHNLVLFNPDGSTKVAVQGDTSFFTGPAQRTYQVPALPAGAYPYKCEVHPGTMNGTLTVK